MTKMAKHIVFLGLFVFISGMDGGKILVMVTAPSKSHFIFFNSIIEGLSRTNHDVTVLAFQPLKSLRGNVKVLQTKLPTYLTDPTLLKDYLLNALKSGPIAQMNDLVNVVTENCEDLLADEVLKTLLISGEQYDAVLVDSFGDCSTAIASKLGKHIIKIYGCAWWPWEHTQIPTPPSYVPNFFDPLTQKMNFWQRFQNAVAIFGVRLVNEYKWRQELRSLLRRYFPEEPDLLEEAEKKVVLALTNGDPVLNSPRPTMPNVINCGGLHCRDPKPLPKDLLDFVEKSGDNGFILFSLGTTMQSEFLTPEFCRSFLNAFARLKQNVIWKYEAELDNLPENVKIVKWMPQQDLLGHPKIRLFITHSGLLSLQETVYHGVPVIGMPFFADQPGNTARVKELGIGEDVSFFNVTEDIIYQLITKILNDKSYKENMKKFSKIFKDQPEKPIERAIFWIEYVLRHNGAFHLRSASEHLNFFQYFLLDVIGFVLTVAIVSFYVFMHLVKLLIRKTRGPKKPPKPELRKKRL